MEAKVIINAIGCIATVVSVIFILTEMFKKDLDDKYPMISGYLMRLIIGGVGIGALWSIMSNPSWGATIFNFFMGSLFTLICYFHYTVLFDRYEDQH